MKTNEVVRYISMEEFAKKVGVKEETVKKRYQEIPGITKEGNTFTILSGTRYPCDKRRIKPKDSGDRRYLLLRTISDYRYISHEHLMLEEKQFIDMLEEFLQVGLIKKNGLCNSFGANAFDCTVKGDALLKKQKKDVIHYLTLLGAEALGTFAGAALK
jgi:hypothetical protein